MRIKELTFGQVNPVIQQARQFMLTAVLTTLLAGCDHTNTSPRTAHLDSSSAPGVISSPKEISVLLEPPTSEEISQAAEYRQLGLEYRNQGCYDDAIATLQDSVRLDPQNLSGQVILGWTLHLAGQVSASTQVLQQALGQDAAHIPALNALGIVYLVDGQLDAAVATHTQAVTLDPNNEIGYYNLSLAYHRLGEYEVAIANAQQAANLEPGNPHPLVALAIAHWDNQDTTAAQQVYQQAIDLDLRYLDAWFLDHLQQAGFSLEQIQKTDDIRQTI